MFPQEFGTFFFEAVCKTECVCLDKHVFREETLRFCYTAKPCDSKVLKIPPAGEEK